MIQFLKNLKTGIIALFRIFAIGITCCLTCLIVPPLLLGICWWITGTNPVNDNQCEILAKGYAGMIEEKEPMPKEFYDYYLRWCKRNNRLQDTILGKVYYEQGYEAYMHCYNSRKK